MTDTNDAGRLREQLGADLVEWRDAGFWPPRRAERFSRRVRRLARLAALDSNEVCQDLRADAVAIEAERD